ncbi:unnamed protein product [Angiostrongylus costaricensis]|uniref:GPI inositol-deacylase n=1 Tax=Angiostrongylus costaricensis TaxID=334426 RepID=A0A0R3PU13_ANGCS|nr:unnamed protein product [Angiostrongylus costaricensis]
MNFFSVVVAIALFGTLFMVHVGLHRKNICHMTYMWRFINLVVSALCAALEKVKKCKFICHSQLNQLGFRSISPNDIPVLFVPGSGGSAKQVRSVASILMNKTEMTSAPFRMHFYAADFDEELSFLSGAVLYRQRDFVMKAMSVLHKMYSRKIVLIGHSFGGTVLYALPAHVDFDLMVTFYESMKEAWQSRRGALRHVVVVSYSGGSKDFQVPDLCDWWFTVYAYEILRNHVVHIPSWSIPGVDTSVDHLCILWCNQLIRYGMFILCKTFFFT